MTKLPKNFKFVGPEPYNFQKIAAAFGMVRRDSGQLLDLGLGKTKVAIDIARYRIKYDNIKRVLVVCPPSLLLNWKNEIERFSEYRAIILNATKEERISRIQTKGYHFFIINYESLFPILRDFEVVKEITIIDKNGKKRKNFIADNIENIKKLNFDMIIYDESAKYLKNNTTKRTKSSIVLSDYAKYRNILTGTLIGNKPLDLWAQFRCLDLGLSFGKNFYAFRNRYFQMRDYGKYKKYELKREYIDLFRSIIYDKCIRMTKEECLPDLPSRIYHTIKIPLEGKLEKIYKDVKEKVLAEIDTLKGTAHIDILSILTKLLRLQQITSGFASNKRGHESELKQTPKLDALIEEVETIIEYNESVIIPVRFTYSIDMISKRLNKVGIEHLTLDGRVKNKTEKYKRWKGFQESDIPVFICQLESGGFGIELFKIDGDPDKTQSMIFFENLWGPDTRTQMMGRSHRHGQNSICRYVDIIVENTIDEQIMTAIKEKKKIADLIMANGVRNFLN